jgi:uncharacterized protein YecE (DUF72 family)
VVHPRGAGARALEHAARLVTLLEANVSHYRVPSPETARSWLRRTEALGTRFTAKLHRALTHEPGDPPAEEARATAAFLEALASDGRCLGCLAQFPPSLRRSDAALARVLRLADAFAPAALAAEFRHRSWDEDDVRAALAERGVAWVVADALPDPRTIEPRAVVTSPLAYLRLHGRNPAWYEPGVGRDRRYDHLYSATELAPLVEAAYRMAVEARDVVVVLNNHFAGQAMANALQVRFALEGVVPEVPPSLVARHPVLSLLPGVPPPRGSERQGDLFRP